jgi:hypothetical protein
MEISFSYLPLTVSLYRAEILENITASSTIEAGMMRCPLCGSPNLVWDFERGEIVCASCGYVVDRIYVSNDVRHEPVTVHRGAKGYVPLRKETRKFLELVKYVKTSRKELYIDWDSFRDYIRTGKRVRVLKLRVKPIPANLKEIIDPVMKVIEGYPRLSSRTVRGKAAASLLALYLSLGVRPNLVAIARLVGVSRTQLARIINLIKIYKIHLRKDIREIATRHRSLLLKHLAR